MKKLYKEEFYKSLMSKRIVPLSEQLGEVALDALISDDVIKSIPILGQVSALVKAGNDIRAYMFGKKVLTFLLELESISPSEKQEFIDNLDKTEGFAEKLGETLLFSLESADSADSAMYLGRVFSLYVKGEISDFTFENYRHIVLALNPFIVQSLHFGYRFSGMAGFSGNSMFYLVNLGLIDLVISEKKTNGKVEFDQTPSGNEFGRTFYQRVLAEKNT